MVHPFGHPFCYPNLYYLVRLISVWLYQLFENLSHFFCTCVCVCLSLPFSCLIKVDTTSMSLIISTLNTQIVPGVYVCVVTSEFTTGMKTNCACHACWGRRADAEQDEREIERERMCMLMWRLGASRGRKKLKITMISAACAPVVEQSKDPHNLKSKF